MSRFKWFMRYLIHLFYIIIRHMHEYEEWNGEKFIYLGISRKHKHDHDDMVVGGNPIEYNK